MVTKSRKPAVKTALASTFSVPAPALATMDTKAPAPVSEPPTAAAVPVEPHVARKQVAAKPVTKTVATKPAPKRVGKAAPATRPAKPEKVKKPKLVRDSFTIPKLEYAVIEELKQRAAKLGAPVKKSELLRAGIKLLATLATADYLAALAAVPTIKTGRPSKN